MFKVHNNGFWFNKYFFLLSPTEITSIEQLPAPKKVVRAPMTEGKWNNIFNTHISCNIYKITKLILQIFISASMPKSNRPEVRIADQIAIRSFVLGQSLGKIGKFTDSNRKNIVKPNTCPEIWQNFLTALHFQVVEKLPTRNKRWQIYRMTKQRMPRFLSIILNRFYRIER